MALGFIALRSFYLAVASAAGRLDHENVPRGHARPVEGAELGAAAVGAQHVIASRGARLAARHAVRAHQAVAGKNRRRHRLEKAHAAHRAVATAPAPAAARAAADLEAFQTHREAPF